MDYAAMRVARIFVKIKSNKPKNAATNNDNAMTIAVKAIACLRVDQLTCFNSPFVSLMYSIMLICFGFARPGRFRFIVTKNALRRDVRIIHPGRNLSNVINLFLTPSESRMSQKHLR